MIAAAPDASPPMAPVVIVHGGAGFCPVELQAAAIEGTRAAAEAGMHVVRRGGSAEDAVVAAIRVLEQRPCFNAGHGATMNEHGEFEVDAAIMRGRDLKSGGVAGVRDLADAILVARAVMDHSRHALLVAEGAERFARRHGVGTFSREAVWTEKAQQRYDAARRGHMSADGRADTVGACVMTSAGDFAAGGSTGGTLLKIAGRVGDTALPGAGLYAHATLGAAAATGVGEAIMAHVMSFEVLRRVEAAAGRSDDPSLVARAFCDEVRAARGAAVGLIGIDGRGRPFAAHAAKHMSWAAIVGAGSLIGGLVAASLTGAGAPA
jgi:beta-aspartyl-peptidase (threonine type)